MNQPTHTKITHKQNKPFLHINILIKQMALFFSPYVKFFNRYLHKLLITSQMPTLISSKNEQIIDVIAGIEERNYHCC